jgi:DNA-binding MarR family transcriptional regulator
VEPSWLTEIEQIAWRSILRGSTRLLSQLDRDLEAAEGISLAEYDVLVVLSEGPPEGVRMTALAEGSLLSKSRLSHCVDRLAAAGLVRRERSSSDRRGLLAILTESGVERMKSIAPSHLASVRAYLIDVLTPEELQQCAACSTRISGVIERKPLSGR